MLVIIETPQAIRKFEAVPWSKEEAKRLQGTATQCVMQHNHGTRPDKLTRDNCGACSLIAGRGKNGFKAPNHAGWERIFVQTGHTVPFELLLKTIDAGGRYAEALLRDLATFTIGQPSEYWKALAHQQ